MEKAKQTQRKQKQEPAPPDKEASEEFEPDNPARHPNDEPVELEQHWESGSGRHEAHP